MRCFPCLLVGLIGLAGCKQTAPEAPPASEPKAVAAKPIATPAPSPSPPAVNPSAPGPPGVPGEVPVPDDFRPPTMGAETPGGSPTTAAAQTVTAGDWTIEHAHARGVARNAKTGKTVDVWAARTDCTEYNFEGSLASVVGSVMSYRIDERGTCPGAPSRGNGFHTLDLATGKPASLVTLFDAKEVAAALDGDSWLTNARSKPGIFKCLYNEADLTSDHFAFQRLTPDRVVVRLGLGHGCDTHKGIFTQLDLTLTPTAKMRAEAETAQKAGTLGEHLLLTLVAPPPKPE